MRRLAGFAFLVVALAASTAQAQSGQLRACRVTSRPVYLQSRPIKLSGSLLKEGKDEYRVKVRSNSKVTVKLITSSPLRMDIYLVRPPTRLKTRVAEWSDTLYSDNEYLIVLNNCYSTTGGSYQIEMTPVR